MMGGDWVIRKRGLFYRPDRCGYTASIEKAGRYTEDEAQAEARIEPDAIEARPASDFSQAQPSRAQPGVTEAMVDAACEAYFYGDGYQWDESQGAAHVRAAMHDALTAALSARQEDGT